MKLTKNQKEVLSEIKNYAPSERSYTRGMNGWRRTEEILIAKGLVFVNKYNHLQAVGCEMPATRSYV